MTLPRDVPRSARLIGDCLLVIMVAVMLILVATYYPKAPTKPRFPPASSR